MNTRTYLVSASYWNEGEDQLWHTIRKNNFTICFAFKEDKIIWSEEPYDPFIVFITDKSVLVSDAILLIENIYKVFDETCITAGESSYTFSVEVGG